MTSVMCVLLLQETTDEDGNTVELTEEELAEKKDVLEQIRAEAEESGDLSAAAENT